MTQLSLISLTPGFSRVTAAAVAKKPFQRFLTATPETVETVSGVRFARNTWLKPGVNENGYGSIPPALIS